MENLLNHALKKVGICPAGSVVYQKEIKMKVHKYLRPFDLLRQPNSIVHYQSLILPQFK